MSETNSVLAAMHLIHALADIRHGDFIAARAKAEAAIKLDPSFEAYYTLGVSLGATRDFIRGIGSFEKFIAMKPD